VLVKTKQSRSFTVSRLYSCIHRMPRTNSLAHTAHSTLDIVGSFDGVSIEDSVLYRHWSGPFQTAGHHHFSLSLEKILFSTYFPAMRIAARAIRSPRTVTPKNRNESTNKTQNPSITVLYLRRESLCNKRGQRRERESPYSIRHTLMV